jgi:hypothetical protein
LQSLSVPTLERFVNRTSVVAPVETEAVTLRPLRSALVHAAEGVHEIALTLVLETAASTIPTFAVPVPALPTRPSLKAVRASMSELSCDVVSDVVSAIELPLTEMVIPPFACHRGKDARRCGGAAEDVEIRGEELLHQCEERVARERHASGLAGGRHEKRLHLCRGELCRVDLDGDAAAE